MSIDLVYDSLIIKSLTLNIPPFVLKKLIEPSFCLVDEKPDVDFLFLTKFRSVKCKLNLDYGKH